MPELPEVETIRRDLSELIVGKKILDITTDSPKQVQPSLAVVKKAIAGTTIKRIARRAKLLQIFLSNNKVLAVHLKLTGRLLVRKKGAPKDDWQRVVIKLKNTSDGGRVERSGTSDSFEVNYLELRFADLRKFGWIRLVNSNQLSAMVNELGIEPFDREFTVEYLRQIFSKTSRAIKQVLLDQKKIAGVGNIYANDALFLARIRPDKQAKKLSNLEIKNLREAIIKVLKAGIKYRGASDQYYLDALGHKGLYQEHFLVYGRTGKKCFNCQGKVKKIKLGGRGTFFCSACQR